MGYDSGQHEESVFGSLVGAERNMTGSLYHSQVEEVAHYGAAQEEHCRLGGTLSCCSHGGQREAQALCLPAARSAVEGRQGGGTRHSLFPRQHHDADPSESHWDVTMRGGNALPAVVCLVVAASGMQGGYPVTGLVQRMQPDKDAWHRSRASTG